MALENQKRSYTGSSTNRRGNGVERDDLTGLAFQVRSDRQHRVQRRVGSFLGRVVRKHPTQHGCANPGLSANLGIAEIAEVG